MPGSLQVNCAAWLRSTACCTCHLPFQTWRRRTVWQRRPPRQHGDSHSTPSITSPARQPPAAAQAGDGGKQHKPSCPYIDALTGRRCGFGKVGKCGYCKAHCGDPACKTHARFAASERQRQQSTDHALQPARAGPGRPRHQPTQRSAPPAVPPITHPPPGLPMRPRAQQSSQPRQQDSQHHLQLLLAIQQQLQLHQQLAATWYVLGSSGFELPPSPGAIPPVPPPYPLMAPGLPMPAVAAGQQMHFAGPEGLHVQPAVPPGPATAGAGLAAAFQPWSAPGYMPRPGIAAMLPPPIPGIAPAHLIPHVVAPGAAAVFPMGQQGAAMLPTGHAAAAYGAGYTTGSAWADPFAAAQALFAAPPPDPQASPRQGRKAQRQHAGSYPAYKASPEYEGHLPSPRFQPFPPPPSGQC
jgi:hypothetical protein